MLRTLLILAVFFLPCTEQGEAQSLPGGGRDTIGDIIGLISRDSLRASVAALQAFGTRYWSNPNRIDVARWVGGRMHQAGLTDVAFDSFQVSGTWQYNVVGTLRGSADPDTQIILGGHSDSYNRSGGQAPGADDNASGTAAVLECARVLCQSGYHPRSTFRFLVFAAEEYGLLGSAAYAARLKNGDQAVSAMLNFDMIAHRNASSPVREFSLVWYLGAEWLAHLDSLLARAYTTLVPVLTSTARSGSDSYSFYTNGYPAIFHYERGANPTYHTALDIVDSLDLNYASDIARTGLATALAVDARMLYGMEPPGRTPETFALFQNYPNPFNPGTKIRFDLTETRFVTLTVFDMLGREVAVLVNDWRVPGSYDVPFDGKGLASGVYLYRLQAPPAVLTRKMVLVR